MTRKGKEKVDTGEEGRAKNCHRGREHWRARVGKEHPVTEDARLKGRTRKGSGRS